MPTQSEVDEFNRSNSMKTVKELTLEYMENVVKTLEHCFKPFVKLNINILKLNPLHYISLPGFSFDFFLKLSEVELEIKHMLKDFVNARRGGICGVMAKRYINSQSQSQGRSHSQSQSQSHSQNQCQIQIQNQSPRSILNIDANYFYGYALMQQLPYKDFEYSNVTLDEVLTLQMIVIMAIGLSVI